MFLSQLVIGGIMVGLTVCIHAIALDRLIKALEKCGPAAFRRFRKHWKIPVLIATVFGVFSAHIVQIWIWALLYLYVGALPDLEESLYFSTSTFTTVGYGDVVITKGWRLLSSFQAANGFILFGWSTAFIFEIMSKLYQDEAINKTERRK
ncbi:MAG: potassium channel family protein [Bdellovibrionales bacterium]